MDETGKIEAVLARRRQKPHHIMKPRVTARSPRLLLLLLPLLLLALAAPGGDCAEDMRASRGAAAPKVADGVLQRAGGTSGKRLRILSIMTFDAVSHHHWMSSLTVRLAELGHHVHSVDIRAPANRPPTLNVSIIENVFKIDPADEDMKTLMEGSILQKMWFISEFCARECQFAMSTDALQQLIDPKFDGQFDVLIVDYGASDCLLGFAHRFDYPVVVLAVPYPGGAFWVDSVLGNPALPAVQPHFSTTFSAPMNLWQRAVTTLVHLLSNCLRVYVTEPRMTVLLRQVFGPSLPSVPELRERVSLGLVNEVPVLEPARPFTPSIVPVGGMHLKPSNLDNIPSDLRKWMDAASEGFIYMSFGSIVKGSKMDIDKRKAVLAAFASLKERVLWKFETDEISKYLPPNVRTEKWLPQNDILGHPNLRLFISHCGGLSIQEASYHGVPVLGVPHMIDQFVNADKMTGLGMGRKLLLQDFTRDRLLAEVRELLDNPGYRDKAQQTSRLLRDQKEPPLERAVWWVEYVARHRGAHHLRSPVLALEWYQVMLLDVYAVLAVATVATLGLLFLALRLAWWCAVRVCCRARGAPTKRDKRD